MHIFHTLIVDINSCLGHPQYSQLGVACEKWDLFFWTCFKLFVNQSMSVIKGDFKLW